MSERLISECLVSLNPPGAFAKIKWLLLTAALAGAQLKGASVEAAQATTVTELEALKAAHPGDMVDIPNLLSARRDIPKLEVSIKPIGDVQFLLSDKPEYFPTNGIALQETVHPGRVRLYLYHVPEPSAGTKIIRATVRNLGTNLLTLKFLRRGLPRAGTDYQRIAHEGLYDFLSPATKVPAALTITPGKEVSLDQELDKIIPKKDALVHAFYEFCVDQPARIQVLQQDAPLSAGGLTHLSLLRRTEAPGKFGGAGRGLFLTAEYEVTTAGRDAVVDVTNGVQQLVVADGKQDPWIVGHDSIDGVVERDAGNYGVIYNIHLTRRSSGPLALALVFCKVGSSSPYCSRLGAAVEVSRGAFPGGLINLPARQPAFGLPGEAVLVQKFLPIGRGTTETIDIIYSPPGAACMPTPFLLVPLPP
jgi:hypothetical protein